MKSHGSRCASLYCTHPRCSPAFHLLPRWQLTCLRIIVLQVQASVIRIRYTRYYVDDNGRRINIHAGYAHKCYRRRVQSVRYIRYAGETCTGISAARWFTILDRRQILDPAECERDYQSFALTRGTSVCYREASFVAIYVWFISEDKMVWFPSLRTDGTL